jgi:hypothetical protein
MSTNTGKNPHAQALGRLGGLVKNPKRAAASRRNGLLGGHHKTPKAAPRAEAPAPKPKVRTAKASSPNWDF